MHIEFICNKMCHLFIYFILKFAHNTCAWSQERLHAVSLNETALKHEHIHIRQHVYNSTKG